MIRRRDFMTLVGTAATWPIAARAQQAMPVIGYLSSGHLSSGSQEFDAVRLSVFRQGLGEVGYIEGRNVAIEYRWADGQIERLPALAVDLVRRQVTVIAATGSIASALAAKAATTKIPIVFTVGADPVAAGLVASLNRPGANLTGVTTLAVEVGSKRLELIHELVPTATVIALLVNPTNPNAETLQRDAQAAARALGLQLRILHASNERDLNSVFESLGQPRAGALLIGADALFNSQSEQVAALALRHAVPTIYQFRDFAAAGGLMSYGSSTTDSYRLVGVYTGRILKGEKPADLPVMQPTKFELVINLKTAKTLGLTVPPSVLAVADEVIE